MKLVKIIRVRKGGRKARTIMWKITRDTPRVTSQESRSLPGPKYQKPLWKQMPLRKKGTGGGKGVISAKAKRGICGRTFVQTKKEEKIDGRVKGERSDEGKKDVWTTGEHLIKRG